MKKFFKFIREDKIIYWGFLLSCLFLFGSFALIAVFYTQLPPFLPLYNKMPWGYDRIGKKIELFIYLALALVFFIINFTATFHTYKKAALLARLICMTTVMVCFFVFVFMIQIIWLMR